MLMGSLIKAPCKGATGCGQGQPAGAAARGWRLQRGARGYAARAAANGLQTAARGQPARGDRLRVWRLQGLPLTRAATNSDSTCRDDAHGGAGRRGGRPFAEWLLAVKGSRHLRRGSSDDDDAVRVKVG
ncbi:hypothetical protein BHE74_00057642 [Ensete ventricosum]|nr:hypothetical protein GW17_00060139 [Ensete ventricosum]RWW37270.1 hypothetical protein BHE74_00057642 [Ensete ventricosum]